jgi:propanediol dehydratase small subunit
MSNDPDTVSLGQVCKALVELGIEPDMKHMREIRIAPQELTITRYQTNDAGRHMLASDRRAILAEITQIRVVEA